MICTCSYSCAQHFRYCPCIALMPCLLILVGKIVYGLCNGYKFTTEYLVSYYKKESSTFSLVMFNLIWSRHREFSHLSFKWVFCLFACRHGQVWELKWTLTIASSMGALWFSIIAPASGYVLVLRLKTLYIVNLLYTVFSFCCVLFKFCFDFH